MPRAGPAAAVIVALALLAWAAGPVGAAAPAVAQDDAPTERLVIDVQSSGDATLTTTLAFDLSDEGERSAFRDLQADGGELAATYERRLAGVAERHAAETGRETSVSSARLATERVGDVGVVRLSVTWTNLARVEGERVVLSAPLDSGFDPDRPVVVRAPDGYEVVDATVEPRERSGQTARWSASADYSGFTATMAPADGALSPSPLLAPVALALAALVLAARRGRA